jgi:PAS domain-containing protein
VDVVTVWEDLIYPADYPAFRDEPIDRDSELEYRVLGLDGVTRCILDRSWVEPLPSGGMFVRGLAYDVTEQRSAEAALRQAHSELEAMHAALRAAHDEIARLVETIDEVLWTMTFDQRDVASARVYVSPAVERLLGAPLPAGGEALEAWRAAIHPDDRHFADAAARDSVAGLDSTAEYRVHNVHGAVRWVLDRRRVRRLADGRLQICGSVTDVTDRRLVEEELLRHDLGAALESPAPPPARSRHLRAAPEP